MAHILDAPCIVLPPDVDEELVDICNLLNRLPGITTYECCSGHQKSRTDIFFHCYNLDTISRLGRVLSRNYSDYKWELVVDSTDSTPYGCFWLRSRKVFHSKDALIRSLKRMTDSILIWFGDCYNKHFANPATFVGVDLAPGKEYIGYSELNYKVPQRIKDELDSIARQVVVNAKGFNFSYLVDEKVSRDINLIAKAFGLNTDK